MELGDCELELKNYPAAITALGQALQMDPTQALVHHLLSRAYAAQGDTASAQHEAALHREMMQHISFTASKAEAKQESALSVQAQELLKKGDEAAAASLFETTLKGPYTTTRGTGWMFVGATYLSMGNQSAAERCLRRALQLDPKTPGAHMYLAFLLCSRVI